MKYRRKCRKYIQWTSLLLYFIFNFGYSNAHNVQKEIFTNQNISTVDRDGKFIFTVLRFPNAICKTDNGTGMCYTSDQCSKFNGLDIGTCAGGYGTCCSIVRSACGADVRINNTFVTSQNYPGYFNQVTNCTFFVYYEEDICQIRYDFEALELSVPTEYGVCANDKLVFHDDMKSKYFCGKSPQNYHWYVETAGFKSPHTVSISTDSLLYNRRYGIRVSYIPCMDGVPTKCGQYYTGFKGAFESFNFGNGYYLAGLEYSICFRKEKDYCTYSLFPAGNQHYIGGEDTLRFPVGEKIDVTGVSALPNSNLICANEDVRQKAMYYTQFACEYPPKFTSVNREASFFVYIETKEDTGISNINRNPVPFLSSRSGFKFDWEHNKCD